MKHNADKSALKAKISNQKTFVPKGWGGETIICNNDLYCGKILHIGKGKQFSWHYHRIKDETFYVSKGMLVLLVGETDNIEDSRALLLKEGDSIHIPIGVRHRLIGVEDSDVFEFSTHHEDDDSVRVIKGD